MEARWRRCARIAAVLAMAAGVAACASTRPPIATPAPFPGAAPVAAPEAAAARATQVAAIVETAMQLRGAPYRLGGEDPRGGFDCSGLVWFVFAQHAIAVPRTVATQFREGRHIRRGGVSAGDLVFFETSGHGTTHVGIAIDGERFIHAPDTGAVVRVERLDGPYWRRRFTGARRLI